MKHKNNSPRNESVEVTDRLPKLLHVDGEAHTSNKLGDLSEMDFNPRVFKLCMDALSKGGKDSLVVLEDNIEVFKTKMCIKQTAEESANALRTISKCGSENGKKRAWSALEDGLGDETTRDLCMEMIFREFTEDTGYLDRAKLVLDGCLKDPTRICQAIQKTNYSLDNLGHILKVRESIIPIYSKNYSSIVDGLRNMDSIHPCACALGHIMLGKVEMSDRASSQIMDEIEGYGLEANLTLSSWRKGTNSKGLPYIIGSNLKVLAETQKEEPEAISYLNRMCGIIHFGRYTSKMMVRQFRQRATVGREYGLLIMSKSDETGALYKSKPVFGKLSDDLEDLDASLRVIEASSVYGIVKKIIDFNRRYGPISFAIPAGHCAYGIMQIGEFDGPGSSLLTTSVLKRSGSKSLRDFFIERPTIPLVACGGGCGDDSIGENLSNALNAKVLAAGRDSVNLEAIKVNREGSKLAFQLIFGGHPGDVTRTFNPKDPG